MIIDRIKFRESCTEQAIPIISTNTESFLKEYINKYKPNSIIEIGSAVGFSTSILGESMCLYNPYGEIISREISYPHYRQSLINTSPYKNIRVFLGNFCHYPLEDILRKGQYDMIFIDGRKSETLLYLTKLLPYIHQTTRIIIDDVIKFKSKMRDCYDFLDKHNIKYTVHNLDQDDGILIIPKSEHLIKALSSL